MPEVPHPDFVSCVFLIGRVRRIGEECFKELLLRQRRYLVGEVLALSGWALHILSGDRINDGRALSEYVEGYGIDCLKIVPSHWKALGEPGRPLLPGRLLIFGGVALGGTTVPVYPDFTLPRQR